MIADIKPLYDLLETCTDDNMRVKILFNISNSFLDFDERRVLDTAEEMLAVAERIDSNVGRAYYHSIMGRVLIKKAQYPESGVAFTKALDFALLTPDRFTQAMCYDSLGILYGHQYKYQAALEACFKAFDIYEEVGDESSYRFKIVCCNHIAVTYLIMHDVEQSERYFRLALEILGENEVGAIKPTLYNNLANVLNIKGDYAASMEIAQRALEGYIHHSHKNGTAHANVIIARNLLGLGQPALALEKLKHVLKLLKETDNKVVLIKAYSTLGEVYMAMQAYQEAINYYQKAIKIASAIGDEHKVCDTQTLLGQAFMALNQQDSATKAFNEGLALAEKYGLAPEKATLQKLMGI